MSDTSDMTPPAEGQATGGDATAVARVSAAIGRLEQNIGQAMVGQKTVIREVLTALVAGGHVMVEGVPGLGKTLLVRALAKGIQAKYSRIQFTPDLMPSDVTGHAILDIKSDQFKIRRGPVFCNFLLADEINRAPAKTQAALLEVMQEQQVTIEGTTIPLEPPYMVLATQNPVEQEGTYPLPEAQIDRFLMKVLIDYPDHEDEIGMVKLVTNAQVGDKLNLDHVQTVISPEDVLKCQQIAATLPVDDQVVDYVVRLVRETRQWTGIHMGAGPRGSLALIRAGRAHALINGNDFVTPDDIKAVAKAVLRHRISMTPDLEIEGITTDNVLDNILNDVEAPRQ